jgi:hypothetical protein
MNNRDRLTIVRPVQNGPGRPLSVRFREKHEKCRELEERNAALATEVLKARQAVDRLLTIIGICSMGFPVEVRNRMKEIGVADVANINEVSDIQHGEVCGQLKMILK